jgi:hypothetical protein
MENAEKVRENRLRRVAERQGLALVRSRRRDPRAIDFGRYTIVDAKTRRVVAGGDLQHCLNMDKVEEWLS